MNNRTSLWAAPPSHLDLSGDAVHVWRASLDQPTSGVEQLRDSLTPDELQRAERFHFQRDRANFIVARGLLRAILSRYLQIEPRQLRFQYNKYGKPMVAGLGSAEPISSNVSHSGNLALYAVTRGRAIGVDIEHVREGVAYMEIASHFFSPGENEALRALPANQRCSAFFACWTRKEAYVKAQGEGLSLPLDQFEVSLAPGEPAVLLDLRGYPNAATHWSIQELMSGPEYVAALAVEGPIGRLAYWEYPEMIE